jgi:predicted TIM-barrel fold metal-dependent hydrolase
MTGVLADSSDMTEFLGSVDVIDVDTHLVEPADLWTSRVPARYRDQVPQVFLNPESGVPQWRIGDAWTWSPGFFGIAGWPDYPPSLPVELDEIDPGAWRAADRLERMDEYGIYAQVLYPNLIGFESALFMALGAELSLLCTRVYNDFLIEWASADPKRLLPIAMVPFWDVDASLAEIRRAAETGHKGVLFANKFEQVGFPGFTDPHWDPIYSLLQDLGLSVNYHIGFARQTPEGGGRKVKTRAMARAHAASTTGTVMSNADTMRLLLTSDLCDRFPRLKFVSVESGFGYVPYLLESLDWHWKSSGAFRDFPTLPSEYFRRQCYGSFWFERDTLRLLDVYPDNFMFETDYPHPTSLSPGPASPADVPSKHIAEAFVGLDAGLVRKVLHDNAAAVYGLD